MKKIDKYLYSVKLSCKACDKRFQDRLTLIFGKYVQYESPVMTVCCSVCSAIQTIQQVPTDIESECIAEGCNFKLVQEIL